MNKSVQSFLIVEDSEEDFTALKRAFHGTPLQNLIVHCEDGEDALNYLFRKGPYNNHTDEYPAFILLDLNLPGTDGKTVLGMIKQNDPLKQIPVIVLSTSTNEQDVNDCYQLGANSYMSKPMSFEELKKKMQVIEQYWTKETQLPRFIA